jgi:hypothetical protein
MMKARFIIAAILLLTGSAVADVFRALCPSSSAKRRSGSSWKKGKVLFRNDVGQVAATGSIGPPPWPDVLVYILIHNVLTAHQGCRIENQLRRKSHEIAPFCTTIRMQHACNICGLKATATPTSARRPSPKAAKSLPEISKRSFRIDNELGGHPLGERRSSRALQHENPARGS